MIGVASSALFDLGEGAAVFETEGEAAYRAYQDDHLEEPLPAGVAFPFIRRLLRLGDLAPHDSPVEVFVMSKNSPESGLRVMRSIAHHKLPMSRAIFTTGKSPFRYMKALSMSLFLSADEQDVRRAVESGLPAGTVLAGSGFDEETDDLRIAFDFDGVLSDDSSEQFYSDSGDLVEYLNHELALRETPISPGPLKQFLADINRIQDLERGHAAKNADYKTRLEVSLVTARNAPAHERAIQSLRSWGVSVDNAFFLGGVDKGLIMSELRPHIYFDDQQGHLSSTSQFVPSVHVPFGRLNHPPSHG